MAIQQIQPQTNFPITRLLPDLGDNVTYYLQAIVRNALTNAVIATVNLPLLGSSIYGAGWYTPVDSTGRGLYITITTSVYTDSGRTVKAVDYSDESSTYVLYDQFHQLQGLATQISALMEPNHSADIDYKKIEKIVKRVIKELEHDEPQDYAPYFKTLLDGVNQALAAIGGIEIPQYEKTDLSPVIEHISGSEGRVHKRLDEVHKRFNNLPPNDNLDNSKVMERLDRVQFEDIVPKIKETIQTIEQMESSLSTTMPELGKYLDHIVDRLKQIKGPVYVGGSDKSAQDIAGPFITRSGEPRS